MPPYIKRESKRCGNCVHFRQHYIKRGKDYYFPLEYGHCTFPRNKSRETGDTCSHWSAIEEEKI